MLIVKFETAIFISYLSKLEVLSIFNFARTNDNLTVYYKLYCKRWNYVVRKNVIE